MNELNALLSQNGQNPKVMILIVIWVLIWKGLALWKAARKNDRWWFIALLVINLLGILEIFYYFVFSERKSLVEKEK
ncbi:MAG: DUF5652 family protein [bacterium]|nr:DUF5652 family protein [Candidatus Jorgensenbacteria bacterium]